VRQNKIQQNHKYQNTYIAKKLWFIVFEQPEKSFKKNIARQNETKI
jgi:hypothetical protein